jgi:hypothetical protein
MPVAAVLERDAVPRTKRALDERMRTTAERPVFLEDVNADVERRKDAWQRATHGGLSLGPALSRDGGGGEQRAREGASPGGTPEPRAVLVGEEHHHLDVVDAP